MAKSSYVIRIAACTVPLDLLQNFPQIDTVECAGTILRATHLDEAALCDLIDALEGADLVEVRHCAGRKSEATDPPDGGF
jgi:hypothetical protein